MIQQYTAPVETLLALARQRDATAESRCRIVLSLLGTARIVHDALRRDLLDLRLSELDIGVIVTLFAIDPARSMPAALAQQNAATRPAVTDCLDRLVARKLVHRERDRSDRRSVSVQLTPEGITTARDCAARFITAASRIARQVPPAAAADWISVCRQLSTGAGQPRVSRG